MKLNNPDQWDHEARAEAVAYKAAPKQVWDNTDIAGPWLNLMRNSLNAQIWSFKHPDYLVVSMTHRTAHLALHDQIMRYKYQLGELAGAKFDSNTLIPKAAAADAGNYEDPDGVFSPHDNSIPALMRRGVVFMSCHNAIWEEAIKLHDSGVNPDQLLLAADLTNHLIPGVVLTPGAAATLLELLQAASITPNSGEPTMHTKFRRVLLSSVARAHLPLKIRTMFIVLVSMARHTATSLCRKAGMSSAFGGQ